MIERLQEANGDTVLEITETTNVKRRLSENALVSRKARLEQSIAKFTAALAETEAALNQIYVQKAKA